MNRRMGLIGLERDCRSSSEQPFWPGSLPSSDLVLSNGKGTDKQRRSVDEVWTRADPLFGCFLVVYRSKRQNSGAKRTRQVWNWQTHTQRRLRSWYSLLRSSYFSFASKWVWVVVAKKRKTTPQRNVWEGKMENGEEAKRFGRTYSVPNSELDKENVKIHMIRKEIFRKKFARRTEK